MTALCPFVYPHPVHNPQKEDSDGETLGTKFSRADFMEELGRAGSGVAWPRLTVGAASME